MMWWLIVLIVGVLFFLILKYQNFHGHTTNFIVLGIILFFVLSVGYVYLTNSPDLSNLDGIVSFLKTYVIWVGAAFGNTEKVVGYAVNQNWSPPLNLSSVPSP